MLENLSLKMKLILFFISHGICILIGRQLTPQKIITQYENVIDAEATKIAIAQATEKLRTEFKQTRTKETLKKPDGTIQISEKTETQKESLKESIAVSKETETQKVHDVEKILVQAPQKNFSLDLASGIKPELPNLNSLPTFSFPDLNVYTGIRFSYRVTGNFWTFVGFEHQILNKKNHLDFGVSYTFNF